MQAIFKPPKAMRGGIPICFPQVCFIYFSDISELVRISCLFGTGIGGKPGLSFQSVVSAELELLVAHLKVGLWLGTVAQLLLIAHLK